jgi:UDP-glucose:(heptosyl)LPS alpha-1,3-glucosyltransferase
VDVAFGIVRLFAEGGLQRDCLRIARILEERDHRVKVFTSRRDGALDPALDIAVLPVRAFSNHGMDFEFAKEFAATVAGRFDRVVGFNKLFGLDMLYCADPPVHLKQRNVLARALPRHRVQTALEAACFAPRAKTHILALTRGLADSYRERWGTAPERFTVLPPGVNPKRRQPELRFGGERDLARSSLQVGGTKCVWLWIGAQPHTKGLDRVIAALPSTPETMLLAVGVEPDSDGARTALAQAQRLGVANRIRFLGYREDIPVLMAAADVLVHPARYDTTGQVVLEAVVNGLPVVVTSVCGFAEHVRTAEAGIVLPEPFAQSEFAAALARVTDPISSASFSRNGARYGADPRLTSGLEVAADVIESSAAGARRSDRAAFSGS